MMSSIGTPKQPKARVKKVSRDPIVVVEAARVGDAQFQHFVETGRLVQSESKPQPTNRVRQGPTV
jgi:hypothetical protein